MGCGSSSNSNDATAPGGVPAPKAEVIFILGGPGSGKGTQCDLMVKNYCFNHISTGDLLRSERQKGGPDGEMIENLMKEGKLVPSELLVKLIKKEIMSNGNTGRYLLDGFPRSLENVKSWDALIGNSVTIKFLLFFDCSLQVMEKRLLKRGETSGRADDNAETIKKRFDTFKNETEPIIAEYEKKKLVRKISSEPAPELVNLNVIKELSLAGITPISRAEVIFVLGGPGSGKGTQCDKMVKDYKFVHLSTGDLIRAEIKSGSDDGKELKAIVDEGKLVASDILVQLIKKQFLKRQLKGRYLIDGFPRNQGNIDSWNKLMTPFAEVKFLLFFDCSLEAMEKRLLKRGETSGRSDDNAETIKKRFHTFQDETKPIIANYERQGLVRKISSEPVPELVYLNVIKEVSLAGIKKA